MSGFDVAAGASEAAINALLPQVYQALYPNILKGSIDVNEVNITTVDFDIQAAPTVTLQSSQKAKAKMAAFLESVYTNHHAKTAKKGKTVALTDMHKSALLQIASSATFTANVSKLALTLHYKGCKNPTTIPSASLTAEASVTVSGSNSTLSAKIISGSITVPDNPTMTDILNKALLPYLIDYLNNKVLDPIKIPMLKHHSLTFSAPLPVVQGSVLAAYSRLGSTPATIPSSMPWPNSVFVAADIATMEAAAGLIFPLGPRDSFSWDIISGSVGATVNVPKASGISDDGAISASIEANASAQLTLHTPWPFHNISFGPSATASASVAIRPSIEGGKLVLQLASIPNFSFSFTVWDLPSWISWLFSPLEAGLAAALNAALGPLISEELKAIPGIPILSIPDIPIDFGDGIKMVVSIGEASPSGYQNSLLIVGAQATVSKQ